MVDAVAAVCILFLGFADAIQGESKLFASLSLSFSEENGLSGSPF